MASGGFLNPPTWDDTTKDFEFWLREIQAWKRATQNVTGLKGVHSLQLALHLPEGSEIRRQVFDTFDTDELTGEDGWTQLVDHLRTHYAKSENISAFDAFKEFKVMERKPEQSVDQYIMAYELLKNKIKRHELSISERVHGLNLLVSAGLSNEHLRIAMREVDDEQPEQMYKQAQKSLKKYFGRSAITSTTTSNTDTVQVVPNRGQDSVSINKSEYETFISWKTKNMSVGDKSNSDKSPSGAARLEGKFNKLGPNGKPFQCRVCNSIAHFERDCPHHRGNSNSNNNNNGNGSMGNSNNPFVNT